MRNLPVCNWYFHFQIGCLNIIILLVFIKTCFPRNLLVPNYNYLLSNQPQVVKWAIYNNRTSSDDSMISQNYKSRSIFLIPRDLNLHHWRRCQGESNHLQQPSIRGPYLKDKVLNYIENFVLHGRGRIAGSVPLKPGQG